MTCKYAYLLLTLNVPQVGKPWSSGSGPGLDKVGRRGLKLRHSQKIQNQKNFLHCRLEELPSLEGLNSSVAIAWRVTQLSRHARNRVFTRKPLVAKVLKHIRNLNNAQQTRWFSLPFSVWTGSSPNMNRTTTLRHGIVTWWQPFSIAS